MSEAERPNIRIEISNNLAESMEVDGENQTQSGREEGEIWEENSSILQAIPQIVPKQGNRVSSKLANFARLVIQKLHNSFLDVQ